MSEKPKSEKVISNTRLEDARKERLKKTAHTAGIVRDMYKTPAAERPTRAQKQVDVVEYTDEIKALNEAPNFHRELDAMEHLDTLLTTIRLGPGESLNFPNRRIFNLREFFDATAVFKSAIGNTEFVRAHRPHMQAARATIRNVRDILAADAAESNAYADGEPEQKRSWWAFLTGDTPIETPSPARAYAERCVQASNELNYVDNALERALALAGE